jgi:hypothetical protein
LPAFPELFLAALIVAAFGRRSAWQSLLEDGDTGWHIRTGEFILQTGRVPVHDLFSFSRPDQPWFAWEWLADVAFAWFHGRGGLEAVAGISVAVLCGSAAILLCWLLRRGAGLWLSTGLVLAVVSASTVHYLARPHIFSMLLFPLALWIVDEDRRKPGQWLWLLVPISALWANLHGGFVGWLVTLTFLLLAMAAGRDWRGLRRYGCLGALCAAGTLANPYGWRLHQHILQYLGSSWILDNVGEFQSPHIRSENMIVFAVLLLAGVAFASGPLARGEWFEGGLALLWGLAALRSARHIPLYAVAAAPVVASEIAAWWRALAARSPAGGLSRVFWDSGQEWGQSARLGIWAPILAVAALWLTAPAAGIQDFPEERFPVAAVAHNLGRLIPAASMPRVLTSDQWADYVIFRLYPRQRVFFDGRSDFYGDVLGSEYKVLLTADHRWPDVLSRYEFALAILPIDWPLGSILEHEPDWRLVYRDSVAVVLARGGEIKNGPGAAECRNGE